MHAAIRQRQQIINDPPAPFHQHALDRPVRQQAQNRRPLEQVAGPAVLLAANLLRLAADARQGQGQVASADGLDNGDEGWVGRQRRDVQDPGGQAETLARAADHGRFGGDFPAQKRVEDDGAWLVASALFCESVPFC